MNANSKIHFRILDDIAQDLSGEVNFPTCLDAAMMVRNILKDPAASLDKAAQAVSVEPLIASKLLRIANSVAYNPGGRPISDVATAIGRLGFDTVRATSLAVAVDQMVKSRNLTAFADLARATWEYSLHVAAIARVLARRLGRVKPEEAMLAGMVHNIGVFYLLFRAADYPEYRADRQAVIDLVTGWHEGIGDSLLVALGMPENIVAAVHDLERAPDAAAPCSLRDILYFAKLFAGAGLDPSGTQPPWIAACAEESAAERERYADLIQDAEDDIRELRAALAA